MYKRQIHHGADAVYIGGPSFGARSTADNSVQDMGLLEIDLPPIQLHASTQTDIRTPEKAKFLQDAGLSQIVLARELTLPQIAAIRDAIDTDRTILEFFVHGALCVAYSGQCYISHAHTGRSANRGDCSQACRLPYEVKDSQGRIVAHDKHVLSMKDNNQSENLRALIDAGCRSFKIEGRYKDMAYVKNITAHYRKLFDEILNERPELAPASHGRATFSFSPDPDQNFNREFTDYFVQGRKEDIGAFDTPKNPGQAIGWVTKVAADHLEIGTDEPAAVIHNGDGLCYYDLQKELIGLQINRAEPAAQAGHWKLWPKDPMPGFKDLRKGVQVNRNRDMSWVRTLEKKSAERRIGAWMKLTEAENGLQLTLTDEAGFTGQGQLPIAWQAPRDSADAAARLTQQLAKLGETIFEPLQVQLDLARPWFVPPSQLNPLRREAVAALETARSAGFERLPRAQPTMPPATYPEDTLTYLANVFNDKARQFYAKHCVQVIAAAYEAHEEEGEVSLMITKHCVRYSLSLCPKQAKGVTGVQGTIRAEPLQLINGKEKLTLRFDCKPCEMHVVGKIKRSVLNAAPEAQVKFYKTRPAQGVH